MNDTEKTPLLERSIRTVDSLLENWVKVFNATTRDRKHTDDDTPGYRATKVRLKAIQSRPQPQPVVTVLYGPSGAGKSTLFNDLTGLNAAVGIVRPTTYSSFAAINSDAINTVMNVEQWLNGAFPEQELRPLQSPDRLKDREVGTNLLFYASSERVPRCNGWAPVLLDLPDFNSVEDKNLERAEKSLERAEQVLFFATGVNYADKNVVGELERACRVAGNLIFVFTQTQRARTAGAEYADDRAVAQSLWQHLHTSLPEAFQSRRADGRTLLEFLANAPAYFIPYGLPLEVYPLNGDPGALGVRIFGAEGESLITWSLVEPAYQLVVQGCRERVREIESRKELLHKRFQRIDEDLASAAREVKTFPAGRFDALLREELEKHAGVLKYPKWMMESAVAGIVYAWRLFFGTGNNAGADREELERRQLQEAAEDLVRKWRNDFADDEHWWAHLQTADCNRALKQLQEAELPKPKMGTWIEYSRESLKKWANKNKVLVWWINAASGAVAATGAVVITADFFISGGVIGTLGLTAALGSAGVVAAFVADWFKDKSFQNAAQGAYDKWQDLRSAELKSFLEEHFVHHLLKHGYDEWDRLKHAPVAACLKACDEIEQLASELRGVHDSV